jgi:hypothetical protein
LNDYHVEEWSTTPEGEARQAEEAILHYTTLFAHPLVEGITWWDMSDGGWLNAPSGLIRRDGTSKLAYEELLKLVKGEWWTPPTKRTTNGQGEIRFSGCLGDYELRYQENQVPFSLTRENASAIEIHL